MKARVAFHRKHGERIRKRRGEIDVRRGRRLVPGQTTRLNGVLYKVLAVGYEGHNPTVHLGDM